MPDTAPTAANLPAVPPAPDPADRTAVSPAAAAAAAVPPLAPLPAYQQVLHLNAKLAVANEQLQTYNEELSVTNEELQASMEETHDTIVELSRVQQELKESNQTLEARVRERTDDLQRARAAAEDQYDELQRIFNQAPVAVLILQGPHYFVELSNPALGALLGRPPESLLGFRFFLAAPDAAGQGLEELFEVVLTSGQPRHAPEFALTLAHRAEDRPGRGYFNIAIQGLRNWMGQPTGLIVVLADVTAQVLARQQVQGLHEELAAVNEELHATNDELGYTNGLLGDTNHQLTRTNVDLDNFIYTASHDLKEPINDIAGLLTVLREDLAAPLSSADVPRLLDRMQESVERFTHTIDLLTDTTRSAGPAGPVAAPTDLAAVVEAVRLDLRLRLEASGGQLLIALNDCRHVAFSEKNLRSVVYNLLSNALKYCHPNRPAQVRLNCRTEGDYQVLEVRDNGLGIDAARQPKLFGLFERLHNHVEGTGVGLYMVKKILENAGGRIEVESELGVGSTFRVYFPG